MHVVHTKGTFLPSPHFFLFLSALKMHQNQQYNHENKGFFHSPALLINMTILFVCVVATGTFVMAPAEPGEPAYVFVPVHGGADLAQREGGGGGFL